MIDRPPVLYEHDEEGQTMAEYAVLLAVITAAVVSALIVLSTGIQGKLGEVLGYL